MCILGSLQKPTRIMDSLADLMLVERRCTGGHVHDRGSSPVRMQPFATAKQAKSATHKKRSSQRSIPR